MAANLSVRMRLAAGVSALAVLAVVGGPASAQPLPGRRGADPAAVVQRNAARAALPPAQQAAADNAAGVLARVRSAETAMRDFQAQARAAALAGTSAVRNGLGVGGLDPMVTPEQWIGAAAPTQAGAVVTVVQAESRAVLTWRSFNVGRETTLRFDQTTFGGPEARTWSVLNRVEATDIAPSTILGRIEAPGQVLVVNRNGVIFGGPSQVNVASLIAGAMDVGAAGASTAARNEFFRGIGIANPPVIASVSIQSVDPEQRRAVPNFSINGTLNTAADTVVEAGAQITLAENGLGLFTAPRAVINAGTITAPGGHVVLAGGFAARVVRAPDPTSTIGLAGAFQFPTAGYQVEVFRRVVDGLTLTNAPPQVTNAGMISTPRGAVTLAGAKVLLGGTTSAAPASVILATTANNRAGGVFLAARDTDVNQLVGPPVDGPQGPVLTLGSVRFGEVRVGAGAVVDISPETTTDRTVLDSEQRAAFARSRVGVIGAQVFLESGAVVRAPSGLMRVAGDDSAFVTANQGNVAGRLQVFQLAAGAVIDLGGIKTIEVPIARNFISIETRNDVFADQPVQRDGFLVDLARSRTAVTLDTRRGTGLFNAASATALIERGVEERMAAGGELSIEAETVVTRPGSRIDLTGGWITWIGGDRPAETRLLGSNGRIYTLSTAPPDIVFVGIPGVFTKAQPRWGINEVFRSPLLRETQFEAGYLEGFDAGSLTITGRPYLAGVVDAFAFAGERQRLGAIANDRGSGDATRAARAFETSTDLPQGGTLRLLDTQRGVDGTTIAGGVAPAGLTGPVNPTFVARFAGGDLLPEFDPQATGSTVERGPIAQVPTTTNQVARLRFIGTAAIPGALFDTQIATADILDRGFSSLELEAVGQMRVPAGVAVALAAGGAGRGLTARADAVLVEGADASSPAARIIVPSGRISFEARTGGQVTAVAETLAARVPRVAPTRIPFAGEMLDGTIRIGTGATLSTAGLWVNDFLAGAAGEAPAGPAFINGGAISLVTATSDQALAGPGPAGATLEPGVVATRIGRDIVLGAGAVLDVSGGGFVGRAGNLPSLRAGAAGTIALRIFGTAPGLVTLPGVTTRFIAAFLPDDPAQPGDQARFASIIGLDAAVLRGFGLGREGGAASNGRGGGLTIQAASLVLGRGVAPGDAAGTLALDPDRFAAAGFSTQTLVASNAGGTPFEGLPGGVLRIAPGARIAPLPASLGIGDGYADAPTNSPAAAFAAPVLFAQADRSPVRLQLTAETVLDLGRRAGTAAAQTVIVADPGAAAASTTALIGLTAQRPVFVDATLLAPGGTITITGNGAEDRLLRNGSSSASIEDDGNSELRGTAVRPGDAMWIAAGSVLSVAGFAQTTTDAAGVVRAAVRPGGTITLDENRFALVVEGARADGTEAARLELFGASAGVGTLARGRDDATLIDARLLVSDAGTLRVRTRRGGFLDGLIAAQPGGAGARGGTLALAPRALTIALNQVENGELRLVAAGPTLPAAARGAATDPSVPLTTAPGARLVLAAGALAGTGIDALSVGADLDAGAATTVFEGDVALSLGRSIELVGPRLLVAATGGMAASATLGAPYIRLAGAVTIPPSSLIPGTLAFRAGSVLDAGGGFGGATTVLLESLGELRLSSLSATGDLVLRSAQTTVAGSGLAVLEGVFTGQRVTLNAPGRTITFERVANAREVTTPLVAGGNLRIGEAALNNRPREIIQAGVLRVPQGRIEMFATEAVRIAPGSVTSIAGDGRTVPVGVLAEAGTALGLDLTNGVDAVNPFAAAPDRSINLTAPQVSFAAGATLDLSGGGALLGYRFVAGPGGSRDVLAPAANVFAIIPGVQPAAAPRPVVAGDANAALGVGDTITLAGGIPGLAAGTYTLLPARFALSDPAALRVTIGAAPTGFQTSTDTVAQAIAGADGGFTVTGRRGIAGTGVLEAQPRLVTLQPEAAWRQFSRIDVETATSFLTRRAISLGEAVPRLPVDAARLSIAARTRLDLAGEIQFRRASEAARGGQLEISAERLAVAPTARIALNAAGVAIVTDAGGVARADLAGFLPIVDAQLVAAGAESLTLGATRRRTGAGDDIITTARAVRLVEGAVLTAPEVVLTAGRPGGAPADAADGVVLEAGATLGDGGAAAGPGDALRVGATAIRAANNRTGNNNPNTDAAGLFNATLVRVGASPAGSISRILDTDPDRDRASRPTPPAITDLAVPFVIGGRLVAGAAELDTAGPGTIGPSAVFDVGTLGIGGLAIALGTPTVASTADTLVLDGAALRQISATAAGVSLTARGADPIALYGQLALAARDQVTLVTTGLRAIDGASLALAAARVVLRNPSGTPTAATVGTGTLAVTAGEQVSLGEGGFGFDRFADVSIAAPRVVTTGVGRIAAAGGIAIRTDRLTGTAGSDVTLDAGGGLTVAALGAGTLAADTGFGARLALRGAGVVIDAPVSLRGGRFAATATAGDLVLGAGAVLDLRGVRQDFFELVRYVFGGEAVLTASFGNASVAGRIDVSSAEAGVVEAEAGDIAIRAAGGVGFAAAVFGDAPAAGRSGSFLLESGGAVDLPGLNAALDAGGFAESRRVRSGVGDLVVPAGSVMAAREVVLAADGGAVSVFGTIDADGAKGGRIALWGRDRVTLTGVLSARATGAGARGGDVQVGTSAGPLDLGGGVIDVGGFDPLHGSRVRLRVPVGAFAGSALTGTDWLGASDLGVAVVGARSAELEPFARIDVAAVGGVAAAPGIAVIGQAFDAVTALGGAGFAGPVTPGVEVRSATPGARLVVSEALGLQGLRTAAGEAGVLTVRSAGDVEVLADISDGFTTTSGSTLGTDRSWSLRVAAGAAVGSADPLAVRPEGGSLLVGRAYTFNPSVGPSAANSAATTPVRIRTGTGSIEVAAGQDVLLRDPDAVIYTAGRARPLPSCPEVANCVLVTGVAADGTTRTGYFYLPLDPSFLQGNLGTRGLAPPASTSALSTIAAYPEEGGDLRIEAGRDILATVVARGTTGLVENAGELPREWLWRVGAIGDLTGDFLFRPNSLLRSLGVNGDLPIGAGNAVALGTTEQFALFTGGALRPSGVPAPASSQTSWFINFAGFAQNFGVLGGGDATVRAGRDFTGSISVPTTGRVGGGLAGSYDFSYRATTGTGFTLRRATGTVPGGGTPAVLLVTGGGDLDLDIGRDLGGASQLLVAGGEAEARIGGSIRSQAISLDPGVSPVTFARAGRQVGVVVATGDAAYRLAVRGGATVTLYDPLAYEASRNQQLSDAWGFGGATSVPGFTTVTDRSAFALLAATGDVTIVNNPPDVLGAAARATSGSFFVYRGLTLPPGGITVVAGRNRVGTPVGSVFLPANVDLGALRGDLLIASGIITNAGTTDTITQPLEAPLSSGTLVATIGGDVTRLRLDLAQSPELLAGPLAPVQPYANTTSASFLAPANVIGGKATIDIAAGGGTYRRTDSLALAPAVSPATLDAAASRALIYALGDITTPLISSRRRIGLRAGGDITDLDIDILHAGAGDASFVWAEGDIGTTRPFGTSGPNAGTAGNTIDISGPGRLQLIAGGSIFAIREPVFDNPATPVIEPTPPNGIRAIGNAAFPLLPAGSAAIDILFGVGTEFGATTAIDAALTRLLDPAAPGGFATTRVELGTLLRAGGAGRFDPALPANGGVSFLIQTDSPTPTTPATLAAIRGLGLPERLALLIDLTAREVDASGREANRPGPRRNSYVRGFDAINGLFPGGVQAGNFTLANTFVRTEQGGDVSILSPSGDATLGAVSGRAEQRTAPDRFGVLTLGFGNINVIVNGDIALGESRAFTLDGGDILFWSSTEDINAGLGARTIRFIPPFRTTVLSNLLLVADRFGQITGSGIGTFAPFTGEAQVASLQRVASTDPERAAVETYAANEERRRRRITLPADVLASLGSQSTGPRVNLVAPFGTVDFGDAGVTVTGDLNVVAQTVLNAENVAVTGSTVGVPRVAAANVGANLAAADTGGAANQAAEQVARAAREQAVRGAEGNGVANVQVLGFGGGENDAETLSQ